MVTLCIHYKFDPAKIGDVRVYFEEEQKVIERSGGKIVGYFLSTDFAGATNEALGLIDLPSVAAYEAYRQRLADDPEHKHNIGRLEQAGAGVVMNRSFIQRVDGRS
jgi:hypothetical protein